MINIRNFKIWLIIALLLITSITSYSEQGALDQANVKVLDEIIINENSKQVFIEKDGEYFLRALEMEDGEWRVIKEEKIVKQNTGLKISKNHESKDIELKDALENKLKFSGVSISNLPSRIDYSNSDYLPIVGTQYEDSCVGWATGYYLRTYQQAKDIGWDITNNGELNLKAIFSPTFIYNQINGGVDKGAYMEDAGELLKNVGAATLYEFPYISGDYYTQPSTEIISKAYPHRIRDWRILYTKNDSSEYIIQKTKEYLNTEDLVVAGSNIGFKFQYPYEDEYGTSIITTENYPMYGHAYVIVGYDDTISTPEGYGAFKIINSWGEKWGNNGFAYITYDAYVSNIVAGYVFTDLVNGPVVTDIENLQTEIVDPYTVKYTWDEPVNVAGYKVIDESNRIISNIYRNQYIARLDEPGQITRKFQAFNEISQSKIVEKTVDTNDLDTDQLNITMNDNLQFNLQVTGQGKADLVVKTMEGEVIWQHQQLLTKANNNIQWNGQNQEGQLQPNGEYILEVIPYKKEERQEPIEITFNKQSNIKSATGYSFSKDGEKLGLVLDILPKVNGTLSVTIQTSSETIIVLKNKQLEKNKHFSYILNKDTFDLNTINLEELKIQLHYEEVKGGS